MKVQSKNLHPREILLTVYAGPVGRFLLIGNRSGN